MNEKPKRKLVSEMTRAERLSLIAFRNVMERKKRKETMDKVKRIAELELLKKELTQNISDFNRDNIFTDNFRVTDKLYVTEHIKFYYDYFLRHLTKESDYKTEILEFNKKMKNKIITKTDYTKKAELEKYLNLYLELYNAGIELDCLKVNQ